MTPEPTGAERYLASRMNNRDYREAYEAAVKQERTDDAGVTVHVTQIEEELFTSKGNIHMKTITVDGVEYTPVTPAGSPVRIVILQRGWVVVGYWSQDGEDVTITQAQVIRTWGTTRGLGELVSGPTSSTKLDPTDTVHAHILSVVASIDANVEDWEGIL